MIRVGIIGPESTGKTFLARALATEYNEPWVPEYAREYLTNLGRPYVQSDLLEIARGQLKLEANISKQANRLLFLDTDLHVIKVWSDYKYGVCDPWILQQMQLHYCDIYLLTFYDVPYEDDPLRENPDERPQLFDIYERLLKDCGQHYHVVQGTHQRRLDEVTRYINTLL